MKAGDTVYIRKHGKGSTYTVDSVGRDYAHVGRMRCHLKNGVVFDRSTRGIGYWYESEAAYLGKTRLEKLQQSFLDRVRAGFRKFSEQQIVDAEKILFVESKYKLEGEQ